MPGTSRPSLRALAGALRGAVVGVAGGRGVATGLYALYFPALFAVALVVPVALARSTGATLVTGMRLALALAAAGYLLGFGVVFD